MTKEQCREAGATMIGWANGKTIQWRRRGHNDWSEVDQDCIGITLSWDWDTFEYRIKPETKLRPWTADEVPARACRIIERELNAANERIRRLEEAGDELAKWADRNTPHTIRNDWTKAKEAKP